MEGKKVIDDHRVNSPMKGVYRFRTAIQSMRAIRNDLSDKGAYFTEFSVCPEEITKEVDAMAEVMEEIKVACADRLKQHEELDKVSVLSCGETGKEKQ